MKTCYIFFRKRLWQKITLGKLKSNDFTIIADDCWAAEIYRKLGLQYKTPCVGLMIKAPCFIRLIENFETKISKPLEFVQASKYSDISHPTYPIGVLDGDVEIHFYHYSSEKSAARSWQRRAGRINFNNLLFKIDAEKTRVEFPLQSADLLARFDRIAARKLKLVNEAETGPGELYVKNWGLDGRLMFKKSLLFFDLAHWLNTGEIVNSLANKITYYLLIAPRASKGLTN